jgi:hypothetical protein
LLINYRPAFSRQPEQADDELGQSGSRRFHAGNRYRQIQMFKNLQADTGR